MTIPSTLTLLPAAERTTPLTAPTAPVITVAEDDPTVIRELLPRRSGAPSNVRVAHPWLWLNEEYLNFNAQRERCATPVVEHAFPYGTAIFAGSRVHLREDGMSVFYGPKFHHGRFLESGSFIGLDPRVSQDDFVSITTEVMRRNQIQEAYVRWTLWAGANDPTSLHVGLGQASNDNLCCKAWPWPSYFRGQTRLWSPDNVFINYSAIDRTRLKIGPNYGGTFTPSLKKLPEGYTSALLRLAANRTDDLVGEAAGACALIFLNG